MIFNAMVVEPVDAGSCKVTYVQMFDVVRRQWELSGSFCSPAHTVVCLSGSLFACLLACLLVRSICLLVYLVVCSENRDRGCTSRYACACNGCCSLFVCLFVCLLCVGVLLFVPRAYLPSLSVSLSQFFTQDVERCALRLVKVNQQFFPSY